MPSLRWRSWGSRQIPFVLVFNSSIRIWITLCGIPEWEGTSPWWQRTLYCFILLLWKIPCNLDEERVCLAYTGSLQSLPEESEGRHSSRNLKQTPERNAGSLSGSHLRGLFEWEVHHSLGNLNTQSCFLHGAVRFQSLLLSPLCLLSSLLVVWEMSSQPF